jgi:hypothetical protein
VDALIYVGHLRWPNRPIYYFNDGHHFAGTLNDVYCYDLYCGLANKNMRLGIDVQN